jgi:hypothetical protein
VNAIRALVGVLVLAVAALALKAVFAPTEKPAPARAFTSSNQCRECHAEVYAEWEQSWHSKAWVDPDVRALSNEFANTDCIDCHAPRPVLETGIGNRVLPRSARRSEGVDCIACHSMPDGTMAGTLDDPKAACRPVAARDLARVEFCAGCHDQHKTVQQWRESEWPDRGKDCLDCHMPLRGGDPGAGRSHLCMGGHDLELVRSAVELRGVREDGGWVVEVENVGAGHSFPTDERSRAADVFWRPLPAAGEDPGPWRHAYRFRSPYRHEVDIPDTLLLAHENRRIPLEDEAARGPVEVALFYKLSPYWLDPEAPDPEAEAQLVQRVELVP